MSRNKHHSLYYYRRPDGSLRAAAINRMGRRVPLGPERLRGVLERCRRFLPPFWLFRRNPKAGWHRGGPGLGFYDAKSAPQSSCKAFSRFGHGAGSPSPVFGFVAARWAQPLACAQFGWPHTPERDHRTPVGMDGDALGWGGIAPLRRTASPSRGPRPLQRGHLGCRDVFGISQHISMVLGCSPARWGSPAALHVPSPAERCIAMTTLLKNSARRLLWGFLLRAHLQTLLARQLLRLGLPGNPELWQWGRAGNGAESIPLKALRVPDAPPWLLMLISPP